MAARKVSKPVSGSATDDIKAKVKVSVGGINGLTGKVGANVLGKNGNLVGAKAKVGLGGPTGLNARASAKVGTGGANVKVGLSLGGPGTGGPDGPGGPGGPGTSTGIGRELAGLSSFERAQLKKKCASVLASPGAYNRDAVQVCRVLAQLAGL